MIYLVLAQPSETDPENYKRTYIGPGDAGANVVWDFSNLNINAPNTLYQDFISPSETKYASAFPKANIVAKQSDGYLIYIEKTKSGNRICGSVTEKNGAKYILESPYLFVCRPLKYMDSSTNLVTYKGNKDRGAVKVVADAWGKLILPARTCKAIRVKYNYTDTSVSDISKGSVVITNTVRYLWFDATHKDYVLRIDIVTTESEDYSNTSKKIYYLLSEEDK